MTRVKAVLYGIPQQKYEPQKYFHTSIKKPKIEYRELFSFEFELDEPFEEIKTVTKYNHLPRPQNRRLIEERFDVKIPIFIRKLTWKLEDISNGYVE